MQERWRALVSHTRLFIRIAKNRLETRLGELHTVYRMPGYRASAVCERVDLECPHCKLLLRNAVQTDEGDRLCQSCFQEIAW